MATDKPGIPTAEFEYARRDPRNATIIETKGTAPDNSDIVVTIWEQGDPSKYESKTFENTNCWEHDFIDKSKDLTYIVEAENGNLVVAIVDPVSSDDDTSIDDIELVRGTSAQEEEGTPHLLITVTGRGSIYDEDNPVLAFVYSIASRGKNGDKAVWAKMDTKRNKGKSYEMTLDSKSDSDYVFTAKVPPAANNAGVRVEHSDYFMWEFES